MNGNSNVSVGVVDVVVAVVAGVCVVFDVVVVV